MTAFCAVGVSLGSNVGDRLAHLRAAYVWLASISRTPLRASHIYETDPVGCAPETLPYLNAVVEMTADLEPLDLLRRMRLFECERGRPMSHGKNAPRSLDLDLLYAGDLRIQTEELTLPHPRIRQRRFVLQPLCEIRPHLVLPGAGADVRHLLDSLDNGGEVRLQSACLA